jgi:outer membrane protein TolC
MDEHELLRRFEAIALTRYATGEGIQQSVVKIQAHLSQHQARRTEFMQGLESATLRIGELIGDGGPPRLDRIELFLPDVVTLDGGASPALDQHPRLMAMDRAIEADRLWAEREKLESRPDFRLELGYTDVGKRDDPAGIQSPPPNNGQDIVALTVGFNIPLHRKRQRAGVAQAAQSIRAQESRRRADENQLRFEGKDAWLRVESSGERARLYRDVIIPQAEESLASAEAAYSTNRLGFLDLLDAERVLFETRLVYRRLISDVWLALAELELALGRPYPAVSGENDE